MASGSRVPRWNLKTIYPGYDSKEYAADRAALLKTTSALLKKLGNDAGKKKDPAKWLNAVLKKLDSAFALQGNLDSYIYCNYSTNTRDQRTLRELSTLEEDVLPLHEAVVTFRTEIKTIEKQLPRIYKNCPYCRQHRFFIQEQLALQSKQMTLAEEKLAADLTRSGADAWGRLQDAVLSNLSMEWKGSERKTVVELRSLAMVKNRKTREKAYNLELAAWKSMEIPVAAALNGVKGFAVVLDKRRHYASSRERAAFQARISPATLDALIGALERNLPMFRRYLKIKAKALGIEKCAFFDIFAPVGGATRIWTYNEARDFIVEQFSTFSAELGGFAAKAFKEKWIDAEPRAGKTGGAYCTSFPIARESRVFCNFDGSFDSIATVAHELGHAYHGMVVKDLPTIQQDYPMTLAETASIFCETIVFNRAIETMDDKGRLGVVEMFLQGATQVLFDILSRYKFESAVFEQREKGELTPDELCSLMLDAQQQTYGNGLDSKLLHPYMWAVKPHYYSAGKSFYNFPYAFGLLFGLGLYSVYNENRDDFPARYHKLLELTGQATANEVTATIGFDIETDEFWQNGIDIVADRLRLFSKLVEAST